MPPPTADTTPRSFPVDFADILGQDRALDILNASLNSRRVHHAWVFSGPWGVGKFTVAQAFAALLMDPTLGPSLSGELGAEPGNPVQTMLRAGAHPDLHIITKELALYSDDRKVREAKQITIPKDVVDTHLLGPIAHAPSVRSAGALAQKVFIIDEAELLDRFKSNATTQNSMLKTLEEPPPGSVIILVTANEERLLTTIRSRCQRVAFRPLDDKSMAAWFKRREGDFGRAVTKPERDWLERFAQGSPGRAMMAAQTGLFDWSAALEPLLREADQGRFPAALGSTMAKLVGGWAEQWASRNKNASKEAANHAAMRHLAVLLTERFRAGIRSHVARGDASAAERAARAIDRVTETERYVATNVNMAAALESLAAGIASR
ncbi:MAG: ATP-binding protein [Phycisphaerales bacterium]